MDTIVFRYRAVASPQKVQELSQRRRAAPAAVAGTHCDLRVETAACPEDINYFRLCLVFSKILGFDIKVVLFCFDLIHTVTSNNI